MSGLRRHRRPSGHSTRAGRSQNLSATVQEILWQGTETKGGQVRRPVTTAQFRWPPSNACPSRSSSSVTQNSENKNQSNNRPRRSINHMSACASSSGRCLKNTTANKDPPKIKLSRPKNKSTWLKSTFASEKGIGTRHRRYQYAACMMTKVPNVEISSVRKLRARIERQLPEIWQLSPDDKKCSDYLDHEQKQVDDPWIQLCHWSYREARHSPVGMLALIDMA
jgi:hypothetical protein